jgi:perosamine synthetase
MSSLEAAIGREQLERLDDLVASRRRHYSYYRERLGDLVEFLGEKSYATPVCWMCGLLVRDLEERDGLMALLEQNQVETRTFFLPMHQQPVYKSREAFPVAEDLSRRGLYLPSSSHLTRQELDTVVHLVRAFLEPRRGPH